MEKVTKTGKPLGKSDFPIIVEIMRVASIISEKKVAEFQDLIEKQRREFANRARRKLFGARISNDFGETWRLRSLCEECIRAKNFEPPTRVKNEGASGSQTCDECGAVNEIYQ